MRKALEKATSEADRDKSIRLFRQHLRHRYTTVPITDDVYNRARQLIRSAGLPHPLRTYDAMHIATARIVSDQLPSTGAIVTFVAADRKLLAIDGHFGFATEKPEAHP